MSETSDEYPKTIDFLPSEELTLADLRALKDNEDNSIRQVWVRRYPTLEEVDADGEEFWELSLGIVPITGIEEFILDWDGRVAVFELKDGDWQVNEPTERAEVEGQVFAHQLKPYVEIRRAVDEWKFNMRHK